METKTTCPKCGSANLNTLNAERQNEIYQRAIARGIREPRKPVTAAITFCMECGSRVKAAVSA